MTKVIEIYKAEIKAKRELPLFLSKIRAGFRIGGFCVAPHGSNRGILLCKSAT